MPNLVGWDIFDLNTMATMRYRFSHLSKQRRIAALHCVVRATVLVIPTTMVVPVQPILRINTPSRRSRLAKSCGVLVTPG